MKTLLLVDKGSNWKTLPARLRKLEIALSAKLKPIFGECTITHKIIEEEPPVNGRIILTDWFHEQHAKYPEFDSIGFLFSPTFGKKIGIDPNIGGLYYRDDDNKFSFWLKTTEKEKHRINRINPKDKATEYAFENYLEHELCGHGIAHDLQLKAYGGHDVFLEGYDNTHYFFYNNKKDEHYAYLYKHWDLKYRRLTAKLTLAQKMLSLFAKKKVVKDISTDNKFYYVEKKYIDKVTQEYLAPNKMYSSGYHIGTDYGTPKMTPVYAPVDGKVVDVRVGYYGGLTVQYAFKHEGKDYTFRFMHLEEADDIKRECKAGEIIAYTGNSGALTTGRHLHVDCWKGNVQIEKIKDKASIELYTVDPNAMIKTMLY